MKHTTTLSPNLNHDLDMVKATACKDESEKEEEIEGNEIWHEEDDEIEIGDDGEIPNIYKATWFAYSWGVESSSEIALPVLELVSDMHSSESNSDTT